MVTDDVPADVCPTCHVSTTWSVSPAGSFQPGEAREALARWQRAWLLFISILGMHRVSRPSRELTTICEEVVLFLVGDDHILRDRDERRGNRKPQVSTVA